MNRVGEKRILKWVLDENELKYWYHYLSHVVFMVLNRFVWQFVLYNDLGRSHLACDFIFSSFGLFDIKGLSRDHKVLVW